MGKQKKSAAETNGAVSFVAQAGYQNPPPSVTSISYGDGTSSWGVAARPTLNDEILALRAGLDVMAKSVEKLEKGLGAVAAANVKAGVDASTKEDLVITIEARLAKLRVYELTGRIDELSRSIGGKK